jgi:hypothetical protein
VVRWNVFRKPLFPQFQFLSYEAETGRYEEEALLRVFLTMKTPRECRSCAIADLLSINDWDGRCEADRRNLTRQGTLGLLRFAARKGLVDFPRAIGRLRMTNFRASTQLIQSLLDEDAMSSS